jgi:predicted GNAT family acetyltransferase
LRLQGGGELMSARRSHERIVLTREVERFLEAAGTFVRAQPQRNVLATVPEQIRQGRYGANALFAWLLDDAGEVCAAALRTPPWPLLVAEIDAARAQLLVDAWLPEDPGIPGVSGEPASARATAAAWCARTGVRSWLRASEAMHVLSEVQPPPLPATGALRVAGTDELTLLIDWEQEFVLEAGTGVLDAAEQTVRARLAASSQFVWDDGGPVSTLAHSPLIAGAVRIGPVYTPPAQRGRGYASSAVAALAQRLLDAGAQRCVLFTDLANPTSNKIYASVGFRRFGSWEDHLVGAPASGRTE